MKVDVKINMYDKGYIDGYSTLKVGNNDVITFKKCFKIKIIMPNHKRISDKR